MQRANLDIRKALKNAGIPYWRLGLKWGCSECTVIRRLRIELSESEKARVFQIINCLKTEVDE